MEKRMTEFRFLKGPIDQDTKQTFYIQSLKRIFQKLKISKTWLLSVSSCYMLMW